MVVVGQIYSCSGIKFNTTVAKIMGGATERWRAKTVNGALHQGIPLSVAGSAQDQWLQHTQTIPGLWMHPSGAVTTQSHALS